MTNNTTDLMNRGMACLTEALGIVEAEHFIALVNREKFDYTKWQREHYDAMENGAFRRNAVEYAKAHPYTGDAERL